MPWISSGNLSAATTELVFTSINPEAGATPADAITRSKVDQKDFVAASIQSTTSNNRLVYRWK